MGSAARLARGLVAALAILALFIVLAAAVSALNNRRVLSSHNDAASGALSELEKAHLMEARRLQRTFGKAVWPGWESVDVPVVISNGTYDFLIGIDDPPEEWRPVAGDEFEGAPYYFRPTLALPDHAVEIAGLQAAAVRTKASTDRLLVEEMQQDLPGALAAVFPYALLSQPTEAHLADVVHALFHAHLAAEAPQRYAEANVAYWGIAGYPLESTALRPDSEREISSLLRALEVPDGEASAEVRGFLAVRDGRRTSPELDGWAIDVERSSEWLKGLATYVEQATLRLAHESPEYRPIETMAADPSFEGYIGYQDDRAQLLAAMRRSLDQGLVMRFHYTGMAQAELLDRLSPGWKAVALNEGVYLEDLLRQAVKGAD